ncbi:MAG: hemerythrin domain-containing protein [Pseudomonadota bacterium]
MKGRAMDNTQLSTTGCLELSKELLQGLSHHLEQQLALCDALENIADGLPEAVDNQLCLQLACSIYPIVRSAHEFEEQQLFPALVTARASAHLPQTLDRLHAEHWEDESFSGELSEALKDFVAGRDRNVEKLGYMLRGFFEGLRRHIAFEKEALGLMANGPAT